MIELGGYLGYSAVLFANEIADDPDAKYYSFELNPEFAKIATYVIDLAGLLDKVEIMWAGPPTLCQLSDRDCFRKINTTRIGLYFY